MHLTKISGRALKGGDFDIDLAQANVITGDNFAGKTRIVDAIRLLLVGYLPELGKTNADTFGLASGPVMSVIGHFSDGTVLSRQWASKGNSVTKTASPPDAFKDTGPLLAVMMNAEEYFALTDQERVNYVFANCAIESPMTRESIASRVLAAAEGYPFARFMEMTVDPAPLQEWIEDTIAAIADDWTGAKGHAKRMEETVRGLTALRAQDVQARPLAVAEDARTALQLQIEELRERLLQLNAPYMAIAAARIRRADIVRALEQATADRESKKAIEEKLKTVNRELVAAPLPEKSVLELSQAAHEAKAPHDELVRQIRDTAAHIQAHERQLASLATQTTCPYCGASGEGWKALKAHELASVIDGAKKEATGLSEALAKATATHLEALKARDAATAQTTRHQGLKGQELALLNQLSAVDQRLAKIIALEEERDRLPPEDPGLAAKVEMVTAELKLRKGYLLELETEIRKATGRAHDLERLAKAEQERDKALKDQTLAAAAGKEMRQIQGELVAEAFAPMLTMANRIFLGVLLSPIEYREGEIGTYRNGQWIGHRTMSGTEKLLTYIAIQAALAAKSPIRLMIADELGRITQDRSTEVARAVLTAINSDLIDQFVGIDPERPLIYQTAAYHQDDLAFNVIEIK